VPLFLLKGVSASNNVGNLYVLGKRYFCVNGMKKLSQLKPQQNTTCG